MVNAQIRCLKLATLQPRGGKQYYQFADDIIPEKYKTEQAQISPGLVLFLLQNDN